MNMVENLSSTRKGSLEAIVPDQGIILNILYAEKKLLLRHTPS